MSKKNLNLVLPTPSQVAWADAEIGAIIHFDMQAYDPTYNYGEAGRTLRRPPDAKLFNPVELDTDQWLETAVSFGAKYAVFVAKHCSGFSMWPTKAHDYSVKNTPWRGGQGDIVADFFKSCRKFGVKPGLYCSTPWNSYLTVYHGRPVSGDPEAMASYNQVVETQLAELWSQYGEVFEIWFDGGVIPPEQGGPNIIPLLEKFQPNAGVLAGPRGWPNLLRHVGNERAVAPDPFWSTADELVDTDGTVEIAGLGGTPDGKFWAPGEAVMPNHDQIKGFQGGWFWLEGDDHTVYSVDHLIECYFSSVGRNTNLLLGMVIDNRGLVPEADRKRFAEFGQQLKNLYSHRIAEAHGSETSLLLQLPEGKPVNMVSLMEDIAQGERVRKYVVEAHIGGRWVNIAAGTCIGHKRLERFEPVMASELRLTITESAALPAIKEFSAWSVPAGVFAVPLDVAQRSSVSFRKDKDGFIGISCSNPNLAIRYSADGAEPCASSPIFTKPFLLKIGGTVKAYAFLEGGESWSQTFSATFGMDRSDWRVLRVSLESPYDNNGHAGAQHLLNDDPTTYWHTYHSDKSQSVPPHEAVLDMGRTVKVEAFTLLPRNDSTQPFAAMIGFSDQYEFHLSDDGEAWTLAVQGEFTDPKSDTGMRLIPLPKPMTGRFIRFVAKHVVDDIDCVIVAGIGAVEEKQ
ncbi:MAG: alpha-L-fucosidase [Verrucomicrobiae bacterium]